MLILKIQSYFVDDGVFLHNITTFTLACTVAVIGFNNWHSSVNWQGNTEYLVGENHEKYVNYYYYYYYYAVGDAR